MLGGGDTVSVTVLVLVLVLTDVLGSVVVVVSVDGVVVSVLVDGDVVSVTVWVGPTSGADVVGGVDVVVVLSVLSEESDSRLTDNHTMSATRSANKKKRIDRLNLTKTLVVSIEGFSRTRPLSHRADHSIVQQQCTQKQQSSPL